MKQKAYVSDIDKIDYVDAVESTVATRSFIDVDGTTTVRGEFLRADYDYYRPDSQVPKTIEDIINFAMKSYSRISIVRNVIDLMSDFGSKGVRLQHPVKSVERFYNRWFEKVRGKERSERFLNMLYRAGNVIVKRADAKIPNEVESNWKKVHGQVESGVIPVRYDILNPLSVRVINQNLATFTGKFVYALIINNALRADLQAMRNAKLDIELPSDLAAALKAGKNEIILDNDKIHVYYYKKDDWQIWAEPFIYALADDLITFEKMRLADLAALDGAISNIRLWTVGFIDPSNPSNRLIPTRSTINKVQTILKNAVGSRVLDLVWGPDLSFKESSSESYKFLGGDKYEVTLNNIYDGMGVPPTLRSGADKSGGSASFIALKTLVERLQYGRDRLVEFWNEQIKRVQKAMGFAHPAKIVFDKLILSDESTELKLLLDLADRDLISTESLLERFDFLPEIEKIRLRKEVKQRGDKIPLKASPYHDPMWDSKVKEQLVLNGLISPKELGTGIDIDKKMKPILPAGRPKNVVETRKRKPKPIGKPQTRRTKAAMDMVTWSNSAYKTISNIISPAILGTLKKKNFRQLTEQEASDAEIIKFGILCQMEPYEEITQEKVYNALEKDINNTYLYAFHSLLRVFTECNDRSPTTDELRSIYANAYVMEKLYGQD